jgi:hypothetical protein
MSDTEEWTGRRLGAYVVGERFADVPEDEGRLYAAHHVETGEPALVVMPGPGGDGCLSTAWSAETTVFREPEALVFHPRREAGTPRPRFHALTLGTIHLAGALARLEEREDVRAHFMSKTRPVRARLEAMRWGAVGVTLAAGLALLLWPRMSTPPGKDSVSDDTPILVCRQGLFSPAIAYPMPEKPLKEQARPPCVPETEVELRGGCWIRHEKVAPCPRGTAEFQGRCYVAVKKPDPTPASLAP